MIMQILALSVTAILVENFIFTKFLGICPFLCVSKDSETSLGTGVTVTLMMTLSSALAWCVNEFLLIPLGIEYLRTVAFVLIIAALARLSGIILSKFLPGLHGSIGIYMPVITINCAILGVLLLNIQNEYSLIMSVIYGFSAALGFTLAIAIFASVRERTSFGDVPRIFEGLPIALVTAALISMAFLGFAGFNLPSLS